MTKTCENCRYCGYPEDIHPLKGCKKFKAKYPYFENTKTGEIIYPKNNNPQVARESKTSVQSRKRYSYPSEEKPSLSHHEEGDFNLSEKVVSNREMWVRDKEKDWLHVGHVKTFIKRIIELEEMTKTLKFAVRKLSGEELSK